MFKMSEHNSICGSFYCSGLRILGTILVYTFLNLKCLSNWYFVDSYSLGYCTDTQTAILTDEIAYFLDVFIRFEVEVRYLVLRENMCIYWVLLKCYVDMLFNWNAYHFSDDRQIHRYIYKLVSSNQLECRVELSHSWSHCLSTENQCSYFLTTPLIQVVLSKKHKVGLYVRKLLVFLKKNITSISLETKKLQRIKMFSR